MPSNRISRLAALVTGMVLAAAPLTASAMPFQANKSQGSSTAAAAIDPAKLDNYVVFSQGDHGPIVDQAAALINAAPASAFITIPLYYFNRQVIIDALVNAYKRGVNVRVLMNGTHENSAQFKALSTVLGTDKSKFSYALVCGELDPIEEEATRACIGNRTVDEAGGNESRSIMHNKFITLSQVTTTAGNEPNVVYISSANLDYYEAYESAVTMHDSNLYTYYTSYFNDMEFHQSSTGNNSYNKTRGTTTDLYQAFFSPRHETDGNFTGPTLDPIRTILRNEPCGAGGKLKVANFRIQRQAVVNELIAAKNRGCAVQVVTGDTNDDPDTPDDDESFVALKQLATTPGIEVRVCASEFGTAHMHEKFLTLRKDGAAQPQVVLGSANLTYKALRQSDENVLRVRNAFLASQFEGRADYVYSQCKPWKPKTAS